MHACMHTYIQVLTLVVILLSRAALVRLRSSLDNDAVDA
jgi:hypothetical protein